MPTAERTLLPLIDIVYRAALDASLWPTFLEQSCELFRGGQATLFSHDKRNSCASFHASCNIEEQYIKSYVDYYAKTNIFLEKTALAAEGRVLTTDSLITRTVYLASEFYNDWVKPQGYVDFATTNLSKSADRSTGLTILRGAIPFSETDQTLLAHLIPHVQRAVQISRLFAEERRARLCAFDMLEQVHCAMILVRDDARILFANRLAEHYLRAGAVVVARNDYLCATSVGATDRIRRLIRDASRARHGGHRPGGVMAIANGETRKLAVLVSPVPRGAPPFDIDLGPAAMVILAEPEQKRLSRHDDLMRLFDLTMAEARLLSGLVEGLSLDEFAERGNVSILTVKTQLRSIFSKTGERRQSALIRKVLSNVLLTRADREGDVPPIAGPYQSRLRDGSEDPV